MDIHLLSKEQIAEIYRQETGNSQFFIKPLYSRKYNTFTASDELTMFPEIPIQDGALTIGNLQIVSSPFESNDIHTHKLIIQQPDFSGGVLTLEKPIYFISPQPFIHNQFLVFNGLLKNEYKTFLGGDNSLEMTFTGYRLTPR